MRRHLNHNSCFILISLLLLAGCGAHTPPESLAWARYQFRRAESIQAQELAPTEYVTAKKAIEEAEKAWEHGEYDDVLQHHILIAKARSETLLLASQTKRNEKRIEEITAKRAELERVKANVQRILQWEQDILLQKEREIGRKEQRITNLDGQLSDAQRRLSDLEKERQDICGDVITAALYPYCAAPRN